MWDLARAVDADDRSDPGWCALFIDKLPTDPDALSASGMFGHPIAVEGQRYHRESNGNRPTTYVHSGTPVTRIA
jgi:hypothetical protein